MMLYVLFRSIFVLIFKILFQVKAFGKNNLPARGGFILASNHRSYLDPIVLGVASPRKLNFMAKEELFHQPIFSRLISAVGAFPVKRSSADLSALKEAMHRVKAGGVLVVFPQGSRRFDGRSEQPHAGIGFLAVKLNVPVIPAFIRGTEQALPKGAKFIRCCRICVHFGRQIHIEKGLSYQEIADEVMHSIQQFSKKGDVLK